MASTVSASVAFSRAAVASHTNVLSSRSAPAAEPARAVIRASGPKKAVLGKESRLLGGMSLEATAAKQRVQATPAAFSVVARKVDAAGKKVVIITGASSGLGLNAAKQLAKSGEWLVVMACRDYAKAEKAAKRMGMADGTYTIMHLDLASLNSVRDFVDNFRASGLPVDALVANAAVYLPLAKEPTFTADGYELSVATNHLGHFLLCNLMLEDLKKSKKNPRMVIVGSVTGNTNTLAGQIPPKADLGNLEGLDKGFKDPITMINGGKFDGAKAYKDSKVCNMLTMREFSRRFKDSGVTFSSLYPGCIADTQLFRNHNDFFRWSFPKLQQNLTKGYVSEEDAGKRLAAVVSDPSMGANGAYWSWKQSGDNLYANYNSKETGAFVNEPSQEVQDDNKGRRLWELSEKLVGLKTPVRA